MPSSNVHTHRPSRSAAGAGSGVDPIVAEIVRHGLNSAANQIKKTLVRTAFSPVIYEVLDFAAALYDTQMRLLAQAPSLPLFMGTLDFCVRAAMEGIGGADQLRPGDVVLYNWPDKTGSHAQDAALIQGAFDVEGQLIGYAVAKCHWLDIGAIAPYCTNTVDVYQEGTFFPGVFLYRSGEPVRDMWRTVMANSRFASAVEGDIRAQVAAIGAGAVALERIVARFGRKPFEAAVERIFDHGEAVIRSYLEKLPDGVYSASGMMDDNGIDDKAVPIPLTLRISGSDITVDFSATEPTQCGPVNCPLPTTISASRVAIAMLAGSNEAPNEGHFRALTVITREGTMFHPGPTAPCFLYGWPALQAIEVIYEAIARVDPKLVPAGSGGDILSLVWWGVREASGEAWGHGSPHPVGSGAHIGGDGCTMMHVAESATRFASLETAETRYPWYYERCELAADSAGPGRLRGGLGYDMRSRMLEDLHCTSAIERTRTPPAGLEGGLPGRPNGGLLEFPDGRTQAFSKLTSQFMPKGTVMTVYAAGGGGWGDPRERSRERVCEDVADGLVSIEKAREIYGL